MEQIFITIWTIILDKMAPEPLSSESGQPNSYTGQPTLEAGQPNAYTQIKYNLLV